LQVGREADIVVLDPKATPLPAFRESRSHSLEETLFVLMTPGDDCAVPATYVAGAPAYRANRLTRDALPPMVRP
jgi:guanine deaminase